MTKLKLLCLHGYNNTSEIMQFQMKNFIKSYEHIADFTFIDGPFSCNLEPLEGFMEKGFEGTMSKPFPDGDIFIQEHKDFRYYSWFALHKDSR